MLHAVELSRNMKVGAVMAACVVAGAGAAFLVSRLNSGSGSAAAATTPTPFKTGVIGPRRGFGFGPDGPPRGGFFGLGGLSAAGNYLGLTPSELFAKLRSGQTLAQIARSTSGKSASGLIDAMTAAQKTAIDAAVKDGRLTQAQADELSARLQDRITSLVNGQFGFGGPRFHRKFDDSPPAPTL
jgi:hypothetical protein